MTVQKKDNPFIKVVLVLVVSTLFLVAIMYIMHLLTYKEGETTLWQNTVNYVTPKPFHSKVPTESPLMMTDTYQLRFLTDKNREEEVCSGFYLYNKNINEEIAGVEYNYADHFCLSTDLLVELRESAVAVGNGIFSLDKEDLFYFVTNQHTILDDSNYSINKVYAYNLETAEYKIIYQELKESSPMDSKYSAYQELNIVGISGSKLILSKTNTAQISGGDDCYDILANAGANDLFSFYYVELSDEKMSLKEYQIPLENILNAKQWQMDCEAVLE